MKKKIIFHIGMPKCGSATIQNFLEENREKFLSDGIFLPPFKIRKTNRVGDKTYKYFKNNFYLASAIRIPGNVNICIPEVFLDTDKTEKLPVDYRLWEMLLQAFTKSHCSTLVISSELFGLNPPIYDFSAVEYLFKDYNIYYIVLIRRYDRWLESRYFQAIRGSQRLTCSFNEFVPFKNYINHGFYDRIKYIEKTYPDGSINVYSIDDISENENIINKFFKSSGIPNISTNNYNYTGNKNISYSIEFYVLLRILNIINIDNILFAEVKKALQNYYEFNDTRRVKSAPVMMDLESRKQIIDFYITDCEKINKYYASDIDLDRFYLYEDKKLNKMDITISKVESMLDNCRPYINASENEINTIKDKVIAYITVGN